MELLHVGEEVIHLWVQVNGIAVVAVVYYVNIETMGIRMGMTIS